MIVATFFNSFYSTHWWETLSQHEECFSQRVLEDFYYIPCCLLLIASLVDVIHCWYHQMLITSLGDISLADIFPCWCHQLLIASLADNFPWGYHPLLIASPADMIPCWRDGPKTFPVQYEYEKYDICYTGRLVTPVKKEECNYKYTNICIISCRTTIGF